MLKRQISELLQEDPRRVAIFEKSGIDAYSHLTLEEVCQKKQLDSVPLLQLLSQRSEDQESAFVPLQLGALADDIVKRYHRYAREQGEWILKLLDKVCQEHGDKEPHLFSIKEVFQALYQDLILHMQKEEMVLFPLCKELERAEVEIEIHCGSVANPICAMQYEHDVTYEQMKTLCSLSDQFTPPQWACPSMSALYQALKSYHTDLEIHMHLENNLLFPAALRREEELSPRVFLHKPH